MIRTFSIFLAAAGVAASGAAAALPEKVSFNEHIRPIFSDKCFACHGFDSKHRKAGLRLDLAEGAYADNDGVIAIKPGKPDESDAWIRILSTDKDEMMPPEDSHKTLTEGEKALIKRWIEQGAPYQKHWAFEAQAKVEPVAEGNPIDGFIARKVKGKNLTGTVEADRPTLIRRASFTLTGLPPTVAELEAFLADKAPGAYERMVDRYLESPRYGEEMGRHWLDVARYGDTHGLHLDNERQMWAYRDWVVRAFNENLPFDQFTIWQLAGDLLPNATQDQLIATGFNRCNVTTSEGGSIDSEYIFRYAVDRASTTMSAWLGLTGGCAVCHDHKFDPISAKEFYSFYAFFHSNADPAMDGNTLLTRPTIKLASVEQDAKMKDFDAKIAAAEKAIAEKLAGVAYRDPAENLPPAPVEEKETLWMDDDFPAGAKLQSAGTNPLTWVTAENGQVFSGKRALKRTDAAMGQDFYSDGAAPLNVPVGARFFLNVYLDPADLPEAVMIQFHTGDWKHRAVWGNVESIQFGKANTTERFAAGPLPDASRWVRLEVEADKVGLKPGDKINGFALTMHGGTVTFDAVGVVGRNDPAADPRQSYLAWQKAGAGKDTQGVPPEINKLLKDANKKPRNANQEKQLRDYYLANVCEATRPALEGPVKERDGLRKGREEFEKQIPSTFVWKDMDKPRDSFVMERGMYDKPGAKVEPGVLAVLPPLKKEKPDGRGTRLDLARWLTSPENPLPSRVTVNRFWQQVFGTGIVLTSDDFGSQGEVPTHPELLDWLAIHFREDGWNVKNLMRLMLTSATFRQDSRVTQEKLAADPANRLYARGPRFRLDAEQIRDNALFVSGLLNVDMGGKGVRTYQPPNIWEPVAYSGSNTRSYKQESGAALYRRSLYSFLKRTAPPPFMANFDAPNREQSCSRRERSNTPLQALQLMNDVQHFEAARVLAERLITEGGATAEQRIDLAYRIVLARHPAAEETAIVKETFEKHLARFTQDAEAAKKTIANGESKPMASIEPRELAAWTLVANLILNLDETVNRN